MGFLIFHSIQKYRMKTCKAITNQGTQCSRLAKENGYCKQHSPEKDNLSFVYKDWKFKTNRIAPIQKPNLITCCGFTFAESYKPAGFYAKRLPALLRFVKRFLPTFSIRFYYDNSILPENLRKRGFEEDADLWEKNFQLLEGDDLVQLVWFQHKRFKNEVGHIEFFTSLVRFLPFFMYDFPEWLQSPPNGSIVYSADIDFRFSPMEESNGYSLQWFEKQKNVELYTSLFLYSKHTRHFPSVDLPPMNASSFGTKIRFPTDLFDDFIENPKSSMIQRFIRKLHENPSEFRNTILQKQFPYGIDELFLTNIIKLYLFTSKRTYKWVFRLFSSSWHLKSFMRKNIPEIQTILQEDSSMFYDPILQTMIQTYSDLLGMKLSSIQAVEKIDVELVDKDILSMEYNKKKENTQSLLLQTLLKQYLQGIYKGIFSYDSDTIKYAIEQLSFLVEAYPQLHEYQFYTIGKGEVIKDKNSPELHSIQKYLKQKYQK